MNLQLREQSALISDIFDSDEHPKFDIVAYAKHMRGQLSDEEEEQVHSIIKKRKSGISKDKEPSHSESVTERNVSTASASHREDNVASQSAPYTESDATTEEKEKEEEGSWPISESAKVGASLCSIGLSTVLKEAAKRP